MSKEQAIKLSDTQTIACSVVARLVGWLHAAWCSAIEKAKQDKVAGPQNFSALPDNVKEYWTDNSPRNSRGPTWRVTVKSAVGECAAHWATKAYQVAVPTIADIQQVIKFLLLEVKDLGDGMRLIGVAPDYNGSDGWKSNNQVKHWISTAALPVMSGVCKTSTVGRVERGKDFKLSDRLEQQFSTACARLPGAKTGCKAARDG